MTTFQVKYHQLNQESYAVNVFVNKLTLLTSESLIGVIENEVKESYQKHLWGAWVGPFKALNLNI
jgi:hypothetical protein